MTEDKAKDIQEFSEYLAEVLDEMSGRIQLLRAELDAMDESLTNLVAQVEDLLAD